ncbi:hypothetical protein SEA_ENNEA_11 [Gordonia phage Ennea]|uniref:Uncharacterized protein n=1 Tax=Gordonia Phage Lollipop1437 TaxID=2588505 RepID=A0A4Y6EUR3_9CAUD|nr:hypothetical protein KNU64_gp10 [Gordonia Phage Lollipop1437]QDF19114.1 hypothetical protein SEA_LOLLIPOP1437_10 [Gordonia Phage Lollipop1437]QRI45247.1 hypothetical protein SEA_ENNEA_11 [Gordonia phage Ennea]
MTAELTWEDVSRGVPKVYADVLEVVWHHRERVDDLTGVELMAGVAALAEKAKAVMEMGDPNADPDHPNRWTNDSSLGAKLYWDDFQELGPDHPRTQFWIHFFSGNIAHAGGMLLRLAAMHPMDPLEEDDSETLVQWCGVDPA